LPAVFADDAQRFAAPHRERHVVERLEHARGTVTAQQV
jgi:hypothetical protein